jgi:hypothetical protein
MNYTELEVKLRDNHIFPDKEVKVGKTSEKVVALHLKAFSFARAEMIERRLKEVLPDVNYRATFMPNHNYVSIELK